jgi:hypothetical protein
MSQAMWQRFYLNKFIGAGAGLIEKEQFILVNQVPTGKVRYCIAIDPGFSDKGNPTGVCVLGFIGGKYYVAHANLWFNKTIEDQEKYIKHLISIYKPEKLLIDVGAQGFHLGKKFEAYSIFEKVNVSRSYVDRNFQTLMNLLESKKLHVVTEDLIDRSLPFPVGYEEVLTDFCSVVPGLEQGSSIDFPQRVVRETDFRLLKAGALRTNRVHSDALCCLMYCMSWAARSMTTSTISVGMLARASSNSQGIY